MKHLSTWKLEMLRETLLFAPDRGKTDGRTREQRQQLIAEIISAMIVEIEMKSRYDS